MDKDIKSGIDVRMIIQKRFESNDAVFCKFNKLI